MACSSGWSCVKSRHSSSVFHNLNGRPLFGADIVQPYLINSSKGTFQSNVEKKPHDVIENVYLQQ